MLELKRLSSGDLARLRSQAGEECCLRFGHIAGASDPSDQALQDLLLKMAQDHVQILSTPQDDDPLNSGHGHSLTFDEIQEIVRSALPSLSKGFGEGILHRDIALFYAESLEEEASRFYKVLAEHARESQDRIVFFDLSEREHDKLRFLRDIVLQD